jgi:hypothetical protein
MKTANIGTISHGTLRTEDLLSAFLSELEWQIRRNGEYFSKPENFWRRDKLNTVVGECQDAFSDDGQSLIDEESACELVSDLQDALQEFAPPYFYFGAHPGDGSDFGFWVDIDDVKEQVEFVSGKQDEYPPENFSGEWLYVSDHGNATLYCRENGKDSEVWAIV